jgi:hypothetical protein
MDVNECPNIYRRYHEKNQKTPVAVLNRASQNSEVEKGNIGKVEEREKGNIFMKIVKCIPFFLKWDFFVLFKFFCGGWD